MIFLPVNLMILMTQTCVMHGVCSSGLNIDQPQLGVSRDMTPIHLPIMVSIVGQLLCSRCDAAHSSLTFGPNLAISVRSVP